MKSLSEEFESRTAEYILQRAKFETLRKVLGNYGNFQYVNFYDLLDPNNQNWNDYTYKLPDSWFSREHGRVEMDSPLGWFIQKIRDAKNIPDIKKQLEIWNLYKPLDLPSNGRDYVNYFVNGFDGYQGSNASYGGSAPVFPTTNGSNSVQTSAGGTGGTQGGVAVGGTGTQGAQAGTTGGGTVSKQGVQTGGTGTGSTGGTVSKQGVVTGGGAGSGAQAGNSGGNGGYASPGVSRGGTKTIGYDPYDPNPGLAYTLRNEPEQVRRAALSAKWQWEHGISYVTKNGITYRIDPQHPNGYVDPFKNDLSKIRSTYATPGINTGGTYATGQGIKDANGNVLTNPGGDWEYQYALQNPQYGLGMMGKMSDAQKNYLQAVSNNMGYNYNFTGATRFV